MYRDDDIVIGTWAKSGTTWMQQLIGQLIFGGYLTLQAQLVAPWLDFRVLDRGEILEGLKQQTHRRFIKTHLPLDALSFLPTQNIFMWDVIFPMLFGVYTTI